MKIGTTTGSVRELEGLTPIGTFTKRANVGGPRGIRITGISFGWSYLGGYVSQQTASVEKSHIGMRMVRGVR